MLRRFALSAAATAFWLAGAFAPLWAQNEAGAPSAWPKVLTRALFSASAESMKSGERDRPLDMTFHGDMDVVDLGGVRIPVDFTVAAAFNDKLYPHYVDYSYAFAPVVRVGGAELALLFHHTSRHIHDEPRPQNVAWNRAGVSVSGAAQKHRWRFSGRVQATRYLQGTRRYVDYAWDLAGASRGSFEVSPRTAYYLDGAVRGLRCDPTVAGRTGEVGARLEAGVNLTFRGGRAEVFAAWDRRIDPSPYSRVAADFLTSGLRVTAPR